MLPITLHDLQAFSFNESPILDESIFAPAARSRQKALELAQHTFYGRLELILFNGFDLKGGESIIQLQNRIASEIIPHDMPDADNITPLVDIVQENASGRHVAWYRYVYGNALSASIFEQVQKDLTISVDSHAEVRRKLRMLLNRGAAIEIDRIKQEFELHDESVDALVKLYCLQ